jgi:undecaprenyl-diphosphatase
MLQPIPSAHTIPPLTRARLFSFGLLVTLLLLAGRPHGAWAAGGDAHRAASTSLHSAEAVVLGVVEGVTEFLPISSTGHLLVTSRILDLPSAGKAGDAVKSYEIAIQFGAILAVLALYRRRVLVMAEGLLGRSVEGRRLVTSVAIAFVPAAVVGVISDKVIKDVLFGTWPVVVAWIVGGAAVIALSRAGKLSGANGRGLGALTSRDAMVIGLAQVLALWPGTSRSLVTIGAALLLGLSMSAAIEFSFLLGFVTLTAATGFEALTSGKTMVDTFGIAVPLLGLLVAFVAALVSIRWMIGYLQRHDLAIFGWYRIGVAALVIVLLATGAI